MSFPADFLSLISITPHSLTLQPSTHSQMFTGHLFCQALWQVLKSQEWTAQTNPRPSDGQRDSPQVSHLCRWQVLQGT